MFPKTDIASGWGAHGTEGGPHASFFKRYFVPLVRYARHRFALSDEEAEDLAARYLTRELERDRGRTPSIFRLFDPEKGRFRSLLATSFWRFCRDAIAAEARRKVTAQDPLDLERDGAEDFEFCRLVAREFFGALRADIAERFTDEDERRVLALKWPEDPDQEPASNAAIERELGLSRGRVRHIAGRVADGFTYGLLRQIRAAGLSDDEARDLLGDCCRVLDREQEDETS